MPRARPELRAIWRPPSIGWGTPIAACRATGDEGRASPTARLEEERNRLAAAHVRALGGRAAVQRRGAHPACTTKQARALLRSRRARGRAWSDWGARCSRLLDRDQVAHALDKIQYSLDQGSSAQHAVLHRGRGARRSVRVRMAPLLAAGGRIAGIGAHARGRDALRRAGIAAPLAAAGARHGRARARRPTSARRPRIWSAFPTWTRRSAQRFAEIIAVESRILSRTINEALREYADALKAGLALEDMRAADLLTSRGGASTPCSARQPAGARSTNALGQGRQLRVGAGARVRSPGACARSTACAAVALPRRGRRRLRRARSGLERRPIVAATRCRCGSRSRCRSAPSRRR